MFKFLENENLKKKQLSGANSLKYLSVEGLIKAVRSDIKSKNAHKVGHCTACLTGEYPGGEPHKDLDW
jgi:amidophosphoribosyltransferase